MNYKSPFNESITTNDEVFYQLVINVAGEKVKTKFICKIEDAPKAAEMAFLESTPMHIPGNFKGAKIISRNPSLQVKVIIEYFGSSDGYSFIWDLLPLTLCATTIK